MFFLVTDGRWLHVARINRVFIWQCKKLCSDGVHKLLLAAEWKICSANTSVK